MSTLTVTSMDPYLELRIGEDTDDDGATIPAGYDKTREGWEALAGASLSEHGYVRTSEWVDDMGVTSTTVTLA